MTGRLRVSLVGPPDAPEPLRIAQFLAEAGHDVEVGPAVRRSGPTPDVVVAMNPPLRAIATELRRAATSTALGVVAQELHHGPAQRMLLRRAGGVVAVDEGVRRSLVGLGVSTERITTIRPWSPDLRVDGHLADRRRELGWRDDEVVALLPGPLGPGAAPGVLLDAASIAEEFGLPVRFVLADAGEHRLALEHLGRELATLQFLGPCPSATSAVAAAADVLVLSEKPGACRGTRPTTLAAAFAAGRPIVAAASASSAAVADLEVSGAGVCTPPGDPAMLLDAVLQVASDRGEALAMGLRAQLFARDALSESAARSVYVAWVEGLVRQDRTPSIPEPRSGRGFRFRNRSDRATRPTSPGRDARS